MNKDLEKARRQLIGSVEDTLSDFANEIERLEKEKEELEHGNEVLASKLDTAFEEIKLLQEQITDLNQNY